MHGLFFLLTCSACFSHGQRIQSTVSMSQADAKRLRLVTHSTSKSQSASQGKQSNIQAGARCALDSLRVLLSLLSAHNPASAFMHPLTPGASSQAPFIFTGSNLFNSNRQGQCGHRVVVMREKRTVMRKDKRFLTRGQILDAISLSFFTYTFLGPGYFERSDIKNFNRLTRFQIQYLAALGDPTASSGTGADKWGLWEVDPGPRGVRLGEYQQKLAASGGKAPAGWTFDPSSWWVEEGGRIMETPAPLPPKRYLVSGMRETTSVLTVHSDGRWELDKGTLYDVTHLPCRSAVYTAAEGLKCTPSSEQQSYFPVKPGAKMPKFYGCNTQDWAVLFVLGSADL